MVFVRFVAYTWAETWASGSWSDFPEEFIIIHLAWSFHSAWHKIYTPNGFSIWIYKFRKLNANFNKNHFVSNFRFRIDNNDHVIDVNKGNLQFEYDQVHIICPYYEPGTNENETEKYIIYNVSKVEYETCRITNPNPRIIAICDKPFNTTLVTISFRPFTPQPGGLEFKPGNDYYFICKNFQ